MTGRERLTGREQRRIEQAEDVHDDVVDDQAADELAEREAEGGAR